MSDEPVSTSFPTVAWAALPGRSALLARGPDATRFVNNFVTADLARLESGSGTEGFFPDARGHVLALANVLRTTDGLWIDAAAGIAAVLQPHLDRYLIRERVELVDASADHAAFMVGGPGARAWLADHASGPVPNRSLDHARLRLGAVDATAVALDWFGPGGLLLGVAGPDAAPLAAWLRAANLPELDAAVVDAMRIEAGSPEPADIDERALPQELGRDDRAISFTKGCYLGQETVARIDALGHVNRRLVTLAVAERPAVGAAVTAAGAPVGRITSSCTSPRLGHGLGLALVHVRGLGGDPLEIDGRPARVVPPPAGTTAGGA